MLQTIAMLSLSFTSNSQESLRMIEDAEQKSVIWDTIDGRIYFLQWTYDLKTWNFAPFIESGDGESLEVEIDVNGDSFFRLLFTDQETDDPLNDDFDGDGISNWDEV